MKKLLLLTAITFTSLIYSQETSNEEYLYMTKGYKIQLESGLDMKKGYELKVLSTINQGDYTFTYAELKRKNNTTFPSAGIMVVAKSKVSGRTYYKAIPLTHKQKSNLFNSFSYSIDNWNEPMTTAYAVATSKLLGELVIFYKNQVERNKTK